MLDAYIEFIERYDTKRSYRNQSVIYFAYSSRRYRKKGRSIAKDRRYLKRQLSKGNRRYFNQLTRMHKPKLGQALASWRLYW